MNYTEDHIRTLAALKRQQELVSTSLEAAQELFDRYKMWEICRPVKERKRKQVVCRLNGKPL